MYEKMIFKKNVKVYVVNSVSEENYIKAVYRLCQVQKSGVSTNVLADYLSTKPASVTEMMQKLAEKGLINYQKYKGVTLTQAGEKIAVKIIRNHRLWELFLYQKLGFGWDEIHDIAEELEHIKSDLLTDKLDEFLNYPKFDPHGDPIPDKDGSFPESMSILMSLAEKTSVVFVTGVNSKTPSFLNYLDKVGIGIGTEFEIMDCHEFDRSMDVKLRDGKIIHLSNQVTQNILIERR